MLMLIFSKNKKYKTDIFIMASFLGTTDLSLFIRHVILFKLGFDNTTNSLLQLNCEIGK